MEKVLTPKQVGKILGVKPERVIRFADDGLLPGINVKSPEATRNRWRFTLEDIAIFKERRAATPAAPVASKSRRASGQCKQYV